MKLQGIPNLRGMHPSLSPDGWVLVTDGLEEGTLTKWCIMVADMRGEKWWALHTLAQSKGAKSQRRSDPHPVSSANCKRIDSKAGHGGFTRLMLAETNPTARQ